MKLNSWESLLAELKRKPDDRYEQTMIDHRPSKGEGNN